MIPKSGGEFAYFLETYGGMIAFGYSWMSSFILKPATAVVILACAEYMVQPCFENTGCGAPLIAVKLFAICITGMYNVFVTTTFHIVARNKQTHKNIHIIHLTKHCYVALLSQCNQV